MTTEFDKVLDQMEAPGYPATCDNCGEVGTNASMEQHECARQPRSEQVSATTYCMDCKREATPLCVAHHDTRTRIASESHNFVPQDDYYVRLCGICGMGKSQHQQSPAPAAPERGDRWRVVRESVAPAVAEIRAGEIIIVGAVSTEIAEQIVREHEQHSTLITQRERLLAFVKEFADKGCVCNGETCLQRKIHPCIRCRASELITSEQEGRR